MIKKEILQETLDDFVCYVLTLDVHTTTLIPYLKKSKSGVFLQKSSGGSVIPGLGRSVAGFELRHEVQLDGDGPPCIQEGLEGGVLRVAGTLLCGSCRDMALTTKHY